MYGLLKVSWGKILSGIIPDVRRILKIKIAGIRLFARLFKPCKTLNSYKGGFKMKTFIKKVGIGAFLSLSVFLFPLALAKADTQTQCEKSAEDMLKSRLGEATSTYWLSIAKANHLPSKKRIKAKKIAQKELKEEIELCEEQFEARKKLCNMLGEDLYHPVINPNNFVDNIDNPYLPLVPVTIYTYEKVTAEGTETVTVEVMDEKKVILGVNCTVVRDIVTLDGELIEDTLDWFAQDTEGNVWYFGELSKNYEEGELVSISGSWEAGVNGAKPGIVMQANPQIGKTYRLEFLLGEAEDAAKIKSISESATVPYGTFSNLLKTEDFTPLEPDHIEHKYYAPGVGFILEIEPESGERLELVDLQQS